MYQDMRSRRPGGVTGKAVCTVSASVAAEDDFRISDEQNVPEDDCGLFGRSVVTLASACAVCLDRLSEWRDLSIVETKSPPPPPPRTVARRGCCRPSD